MYLGLILLYIVLSSVAAFFVRKHYWTFSVISGVIILVLIVIFSLAYFGTGYSGGLLSPESYAIPGAEGISFSIAVSGFTDPLIIITAVIFLAAIAIAGREKYPASFYGLMLFAEFGMIGLLVSRDFLFFYIFWEVVLIPVYFMISKHSGDTTGKVALKFFVYTQVGSIFMLLSIFSLYSYYDLHYGVITLDISTLMSTSFFNFLTPFQRDFILFGFFLAFLVKMPSFPVHAWFPDSYEKSPYPVTIVLTGALSMMGGYGFFGILFPLWTMLKGFPAIILVALGIMSLVYFALSAMFQVNIKRMMAYASAAAMGFVTLAFGSGIESLGSSIPTSGANSAVIDLTGGMYQMIAHALIMVLVFSALYIIFLKTGREHVYELGGLHRQAPKTSSLLLMGLMASLGLPGLAGFVGEFSIVVGSYQYIGYLIFVVIFAMLITASYHVWAAQRALYGPYNETLGSVKDINSGEFALFILLAVLIVILGLFPNLFFGLFTSYLGGF